MRARGAGERRGWRRVGTAAVLVVVVALLGIGVALVVAGGVLGLGVAVVGHGAGGRPSLQAPLVVLALGVELIAAAALFGGRAGARIPTEEDDGRGPVVG